MFAIRAGYRHEDASKVPHDERGSTFTAKLTELAMSMPRAPRGATAEGILAERILGNVAFEYDTGSQHNFGEATAVQCALRLILVGEDAMARSARVVQESEHVAGRKRGDEQLLR